MLMHLTSTTPDADTSTSIDLAFLHERGLDPARALREDERRATAAVRAAAEACDGVLVRLGGRAGRLGETVVATALLEGVLLGLRTLGRVGVPVHIAVDGPAAELFDAATYREQHWPEIEVVPLPAAIGAADASSAALVRTLPGRRPLVFDLHGGHDGMPALEIAGEHDVGGQRIATCTRLFRTGVRAYAAHGPARRYADFVEDLLNLDADSVDGERAQPTLAIAAEREDAQAISRRYDLRPGTLRIAGIFQSVVPAKCYGHWEAVLDGVCRHVAERVPGAAVDVVLACGPDEQNPEGVRLADLEAELGAFTGTGGNARVRVVRTETLRDLAALLARAALVLANDTGPGHVAGALGVPTVTPYLPGEVYSRRVWASSPQHRGVTLDPNPYTRRQIEQAVLWANTGVIDSIPPDEVIRAALAALPAPYRAHAWGPPGGRGDRRLSQPK